MGIFLSILSISYFILFLIFLVAWNKIEPVAELNHESRPWPFISVIVAVRNEVTNIKALVNDLVRQEYPQDHFEVIIVDDGSTDGTLDVLQKCKGTADINLKALSLPVGITGKKKAIQAGIAKAKGEIIATTDGDCRVGDGWLSVIAASFRENNRAMVCGAVAFDGEMHLFEHLQSIEFSGLIGSGAASLQLGAPNMCNGANLAFTREAFYVVNGYEGSEHIPSGDDEFLMHKVYHKFPGKVTFVKNKDAIVKTNPHKKLRDFIQQRKRWAGKWRMHSDPRIKILALFIFVYHLGLLIALPLVILGAYSLKLFLIQLSFKFIAEFVFLSSVMDFLKKRLKLAYFIPLSVIYPFYVVFFGLAANIGSYEWKGRTSR